MNRRDAVKVLPVAALAGIAVKLGEVDGVAHEVKPGKKYLIVVPDLYELNAVKAREILLSRGIDATFISGEATIYELE